MSAKSNQDKQKAADQPNAQVIFDDRFKLFMDQFGATCESQEIPLAIAIVIDPTIQDQTPLIYCRGHKYDIAKTLAKVLRNIKATILSELEA